MSPSLLFSAISRAFPAQSSSTFSAIPFLLVSGLLHAGENLPELGQPQKPPSLPAMLRPGPGGINFASDDVDSRLSTFIDTSRQAGASVGVRGATAFGEHLAVGGGAQLGGRWSELYLNLGLRIAAAQRLMLTGGHLRQKLDYDFPSGEERAVMTQKSAGVTWRFDLNRGWLDHAELGAYAADTPSRDLADKTWNVDTATAYELWRDPRRIAGSRLTGLQGRLGLLPWEGGRATVGVGHETLRYDLQAGDETRRRPTASLGLEQVLNRETRLRLGADGGAAQNRYTVGLDRRIGDLGILGVTVANLQGRDGTPGDTRVQMSWSIPLGGRPLPGFKLLRPEAGRPESGHVDTAPQPAMQWSRSLLDQVAQRPQWMPMQVIAKRDVTAVPTRLVVIDKTALPVGTQVDAGTGTVAVPLGIAAAGIIGVTLNGAFFANTGQFSLSGTQLVIDSERITQPMPGALDTYVVTVNHVDGSGSNVTVKVARGSVKIVSIDVAPAIIVDTIPNAFSFAALTNQAYGILVESSAIIVSGINGAASINVSGGEYQIDGGAWISASGTIANGQSVKLRHTTAAVKLAKTTTVLTIGGISGSFASTTSAVPIDATPDVFSFAEATSQSRSTVVESGAIVVAGIDAPANISISGGEYQINGGAWSSGTGTVTVGQSVKVRHTTSANYASAVTTTLTIGGVSGSFKSTTAVAPADSGGSPPVDTTPNTFSFTDFTGQALSTVVESNAITVAGINAAAAISVTGGEYQINGGAWTSSAGTVTVGQTVKVRHTTSASNSTATNTTLTIGGVSDTFTTTTVAAADTPTSLSAPTLESKTSTSINTTPGTFSDSDGQRNITTKIYSDAGLTVLLGANVNGDFSGLNPAITYYIRTEGEALNGMTGGWEAKTTPALTVVIMAADTTAPATPSLSITPLYTNQNSVTVEVNGEIGASIWVNGTSTGSTIAGTGKTSIQLDTSGADGAKNFSITLKDLAGNASAPLNLSIEKSVVAPASVNWSGTTPTAPSTTYNGLILAGDKSFTGASGLSVSSSAGGSITGLSVNGSGQITFNFSTPAAASTTLTISGTDRYGNPINISKAISLADTTAPATPSIAISDSNADKPAGFTNDTSVTVAITGDTDNVGVTGWYVSESSSSPVAGSGGWVGTRPTTATISAGNGAKTLYVWTKDGAGNVSGTGSGSITLQTP